MAPPPPLAVKIDGQLLSDEEGRALWTRFSAFMEEHRGDLAGFAKTEGLASIHPAMEGDRAILVGSRATGAAQRAYASVGVEAEEPARPGNQAKPKRRRRR